MSFIWPENFGYLLLLIPLAVLFGYGFMRRTGVREIFFGRRPDGDHEQRRLIGRHVLHFTGIALLLLSLAGPRLSYGTRMSLRRSADVVFMLDVSNSMLARDVPPSRLERSKMVALAISRRLPESRRALLLFAARPLVQCPLTHDREAFDSLLGMASPELISEQGTAFGNAFEQAIGLLFVPQGSPVAQETAGERIIVLLSDGEDHEGGAQEAARRLGRAGIRLVVLGVGRTGDAVIPDSRSPGGIKLDEAGVVVKSRFNAEALRELAAAAGGIYINMAEETAGADNVARRIGRIIEASRPVEVPVEEFPLYPILLAAGVLLLLAEIMTDGVGRRMVH